MGQEGKRRPGQKTSEVKTMKITQKHVLIVVLLAVSAGLAYDSMANYMNPYIPVADVASNPAKYMGKSLQVIGIVEPGSVEFTNDGRLNFVLMDDSGSIPVTYQGIPPNNLEDEGNSVVVLGEIGDNEIIESEELLVKCPSKYEGEEPEQEGLSHVFLATIGVALLGAGYLVITMFTKK
jgi:cytochrome c-type biogenesis protein CcmE